MNIANLVQMTSSGAEASQGANPAGFLTNGEIKGNSPGATQASLFSQLLGGQTAMQSADFRQLIVQLQQSGDGQMRQELPAGGNLLPDMMDAFAQGTVSGQVPLQAGVAPPGLLSAQGTWPGNHPLTDEDMAALEALLEGVGENADPATSALSVPQVVPAIAQRIHAEASMNAQGPLHLDKQAMLASVVDQGDVNNDGLEITSLSANISADKLSANFITAVTGAHSAAGDENINSISASALSVAERGQAGQVQRTSADLQLPMSMNKPEWSNELGDRVLWMTRQDVQSARIQINPPHLGPIEVRVSIQNDTAHVAFSAHHAQVREVIEQAIPRLREMLDSSGFTQANVDVSDHSFAKTREQLADQGFNQAWDEQADDASFEEVGVTVSSVKEMQGQGLIDYFA